MVCNRQPIEEQYRIRGSREFLRDRIRGLTESLGTLPGRLSQYAAQLQELEKLDFPGLRQRLGELEKERSRLQACLFSPEEQARTRAEARITSTRQRLISLETEDRRCREALEALADREAFLRQAAFPEHCPRLGGPLPEPARRAALEAFRCRKGALLQELLAQSARLRARRSRLQEEMAQVKEELRREEALTAQGSRLRRELQQINGEMTRVREQLDREVVKNWIQERQGVLLELRRSQSRELESCRARLRALENKEE